MEGQQILANGAIGAVGPIEKTEIAAFIEHFASTDFPITITVYSIGIPIAKISADNNGLYSAMPPIPADFGDIGVAVKTASSIADMQVDTVLTMLEIGPYEGRSNGRNIRVVIRNYPVTEEP